MVADAVAFEPVSTPKFPANGEKNREFVHFRSFAAKSVSMRSMIAGLLS
jgi:hypothetical protein